MFSRNLCPKWAKEKFEEDWQNSKGQKKQQAGFVTYKNTRAAIPK